MALRAVQWMGNQANKLGDTTLWGRYTPLGIQPGASIPGTALDGCLGAGRHEATKAGTTNPRKTPKADGAS